nr:MAG TPA: hypothetical protein [Caudoviricetes sp.]
MRFQVYNVVEYRSDDPSWIMWRVKHTDGKDYLMAYSKGKLKEVYFVGEGIPNYFVSFRADDVSHISHYYVDDKLSVVRRYENYLMNRVYHDNKDGVMWCDTHKYKQKYLTKEFPNFAKLEEDLVKLIAKVKATGIKIERPSYVR